MDDDTLINLIERGVSIEVLAQLIGAIVVDERSVAPGIQIDEVVDDSRSDRLGTTRTLFLARYSRSARERDPAFIARIANAAVDAGAVAVVADFAVPGLAERVPVLVCPDVESVAGLLASCVHGDPSRHLKVILVTGTDGKTTTATLTAAAIAEDGFQVGRQTTVGHVIGGAADAATLTTAEAVDVQRSLARSRNDGDESVVIEASSIAAMHGRLNAVRADVVVFTNLSAEHQDSHGTMLRYFAAKADLFDPADGRVAVVNIDDPWGEILLETLLLVGGEPVLVSPSGRRHSRSGRPVAVRCTDRRLHPQAGSEVTAEVGDAEVRFHVQLEGKHNVANALCALAVAHVLGIDAATAARGIARVERVNGRLDVIPNEAGVLAYVDYAHTPQALKTVLASLRERSMQRNGRIIVVAGCGGGRDETKRAAMGSACSLGADVFIATDDNPRNERSEHILDAMIGDLQGVRRIPDRRQAIAAAVAEARAGDIIVVAGKGHEQEQIVEGERTRFVDHEVLAQALGTHWTPEASDRPREATA